MNRVLFCALAVFALSACKNTKTLFRATFEQDAVDQPPATDPPEEPEGDSLTSQNALVASRAQGNGESHAVRLTGGGDGGSLLCKNLPPKDGLEPKGVASIFFTLTVESGSGTPLLILARTGAGNELARLVLTGDRLTAADGAIDFPLPAGEWQQVIWHLDYKRKKQRLNVIGSDQVDQDETEWTYEGPGPARGIRSLEFFYTPDFGGVGGMPAVEIESVSIQYTP